MLERPRRRSRYYELTSKRRRPGTIGPAPSHAPRGTCRAHSAHAPGGVRSSVSLGDSDETRCTRKHVGVTRGLGNTTKILPERNDKERETGKPVENDSTVLANRLETRGGRRLDDGTVGPVLACI